MKLNRVIVLLRDENVDLRARNIDIQTDYVILDESYKNFITVSILNDQIPQCKPRNKSQTSIHIAFLVQNRLNCLCHNV